MKKLIKFTIAITITALTITTMNNFIVSVKTAKEDGHTRTLQLIRSTIG